MPSRSIVYTERTECRDCYKCVRECPVKAIKIDAGHATVIDALCLQCGHCVEVCPVKAKRVRSDLGKAQRLLADKPRVIASLAPSWVAEFPDVPAARMIAALRRLGLQGASETALGAQEVSASVAADLAAHRGGVFISSACPTVVRLIKEYYPAYQDRITELLSPVLAHCKLLRSVYGPEIGVLFIGPCISKKSEADARPELLDAAITFAELRQWMAAANVRFEAMQPCAEDRFIPEPAREGALYPIDGGMIAGIRADCAVTDAAFMSFSGVENIRRALAGLAVPPDGRALFLELLACEGGCVNGPQSEARKGTARKRLQVITRTESVCRATSARPAAAPRLDLRTHFAIPPAEPRPHTEEEIRTVLLGIGKVHLRDELNCGGCGYDSCRDFARALLDGKAERTMCVSYMRKLAQKKANALIRTMPCGVLIVDDQLRIVECNRRLAAMMGREEETIYEASPGLEGALLEKVVPFHKYFRTVLETGADLVEKDVRVGAVVFHLTIFTIEKHHVVGGIVEDVTAPSVRKERITGQAREVMRKQLHTVQQIAYLLGEHAAESEVILNSIVEAFEPPDDRGEEGE